MTDKPKDNNKNKRKALSPNKSVFISKAQVQPLRIEDMIISIAGKSKLYFVRLKYKGCPTLTSGFHTKPHFKEGTVLIDMNRDAFIRELYSLLNEITTQTCCIYFKSLVSYVQWLDDNDVVVINGDYTNWRLIDDNMTWCAAQVKLGQMTKKNWANRKDGISWLLRAQGRKRDADNLPSIKGGKKETTPHKSLDLISEFKPVVKALFRAYKQLLKHFNENTTPERHPLWDKELSDIEAARRGLKGRKLGAHRAAFKTTLIKAHPNNHIVRIAMLICYMFTGINTKPLASLKISDVTFKEVKGGKYLINSVKGRAGWQEQDNSLGFTKRAKEYIESWLKVAAKMTDNDLDAPLFPFFYLNGDVEFYSKTRATCQGKVNMLLERLGLSTVTPSRFRKTKLDTIFRITEDVYIVSMSANSDIKTVKRSYLHGTESEHQNNLGASMHAQFNIAKGKDVPTATSEAKFKFSDVLDDYEYQRLRKGEDRSHESRTPTGTRCNDNRKGSAAIIDKLLKQEGIEQDADEVACTDFLACWGCSEHALVADVTDIWLMLSFKETLQQLKQTPAVNSMPEKKLTNLFMDIESVLERFKEKSLKNYQQAEDKLKDAPHPLYSTVYSLNDLLETFS
jgi:integrase